MTRWTLALAGLLALGAVRSGLAQVEPPTAEEIADLESKRDKKLAEAWVKKAPWTTDLDEARKRASESGHPILAYFSRSYAP